MRKASRRKHWLGLDVGGTKVLTCVFDQDFELIGAQKKKNRADGKAGLSPSRLLDVTREALDELGIDPATLAGVGVGAAGWLDLDRGVLLQAPNLGWHNVKLAQMLRRAFGVPAVLANDVDAGTYAEYRFGAARKARCVVGVFPGTGIGGGCVYEGRLLRGKVSSCMEIGHYLIAPDGPLCGCGRRGCLEAVASRLAISAAAAAAAFRGEAPHLLRLAGTDVAKIRSGDLGAAIRAGDRVVEQIVRHAAQQIGQALVSVVHLLAPDTILLGGGLVEELPELFASEVGQTVRGLALATYTQDLRFVTAKLSGHATAMGAAALAAAHVTGRS